MDADEDGPEPLDSEDWLFRCDMAIAALTTVFVVVLCALALLDMTG